MTPLRRALSAPLLALLLAVLSLAACGDRRPSDTVITPGESGEAVPSEDIDPEDDPHTQA